MLAVLPVPGPFETRSAWLKAASASAVEAPASWKALARSEICAGRPAWRLRLIAHGSPPASAISKAMLTQWSCIESLDILRPNISRSAAHSSAAAGALLSSCAPGRWRCRCRPTSRTHPSQLCGCNACSASAAASHTTSSRAATRFASPRNWATIADAIAGCSARACSCFDSAEFLGVLVDQQGAAANCWADPANAWMVLASGSRVRLVVPLGPVHRDRRPPVSCRPSPHH